MRTLPLAFKDPFLSVRYSLPCAIVLNRTLEPRWRGVAKGLLLSYLGRLHLAAARPHPPLGHCCCAQTSADRSIIVSAVSSPINTGNTQRAARPPGRRPEFSMGIYSGAEYDEIIFLRIAENRNAYYSVLTTEITTRFPISNWVCISHSLMWHHAVCQHRCSLYSVPDAFLVWPADYSTDR